MKLSKCCEAKLVAKVFPEMCTECGEFCETIIIPTTHEEKTFYLYGINNMSSLKGEIPFLKKRLELLNIAKTEAVRLSDYVRVTDIIKAEKLFRDMIKEIPNEPISNDRAD